MQSLLSSIMIANVDDMSNKDACNEIAIGTIGFNKHTFALKGGIKGSGFYSRCRAIVLPNLSITMVNVRKMLIKLALYHHSNQSPLWVEADGSCWMTKHSKTHMIGHLVAGNANEIVYTVESKTGTRVYSIDSTESGLVVYED